MQPDTSSLPRATPRGSLFFLSSQPQKKATFKSPALARAVDVPAGVDPIADATPPVGQKAARHHYVVVVNNSAGSSSRFDEVALKAASPDATFDIISAAPHELEGAFDKAFSEKPSAVIVVGGDGTARTAAVRAVQTGVPIVPMPGGTMNVLPKIVFGHGDMARAIVDLPRLELRSLDVGRVGGEMFFLSVAFGLAGPMARVREAARSQNKLKRMWEAGSTFFRSVGPSLHHRVHWRKPGDKWRKVHSLIIAIGDIDRILSPDTEDHGSRFEVVALKVKSVWQMLTFGVAFVAGDWRNSKNLKMVRARSVELKLPGRRPLAVLDGEPMRLSHIGTVTLDLGALPVLALPSEPVVPGA